MSPCMIHELSTSDQKLKLTESVVAEVSLPAMMKSPATILASCCESPVGVLRFFVRYDTLSKLAIVGHVKDETTRWPLTSLEYHIPPSQFSGA